MISIDELADFSQRMINQGMALAQRVQELEKKNAELTEALEKKEGKKNG